MDWRSQWEERNREKTAHGTEIMEVAESKIEAMESEFKKSHNGPLLVQKYIYEKTYSC